MIQKWYATLGHPNIPYTPHLGFLSQMIQEICSEKQLFLKLGQESSSQWTEEGMWHSPPKDTFTHRLWNSYLHVLDCYVHEYRRYALDSMPILETRSDVKVTQGCYATLRHHKMHAHTKFWIPTSNNIRYMLLTRILKKLGQRSRSPWPENGTQHSTTPRWIHRPNLGFLPSRI